MKQKKVVKYRVRKGNEPTRKQLSYMSGRNLSTVENWANGKAEMPEHIYCANEDVKKFINQKKKEIEVYENGHRK